jgi:hypothetical protein
MGFGHSSFTSQWDSTIEAKPRHPEIKIRFDDMIVKLAEAALLQKSIGRVADVRWFGFVAERRLNLARPFKAGIVTSSKSRRVSDD